MTISLYLNQQETVKLIF